MLGCINTWNEAWGCQISWEGWKKTWWWDPVRGKPGCRGWRAASPQPPWLLSDLLSWCFFLDLPGVPDAAAQPVQLLRPPADPRPQVPLLLPGVWGPLPLCLLPDPREGELLALCPQGGLQVGAAWRAVLGWPSGRSFPGSELISG